MIPDHEELAEWDAAYVLGALTPTDRARFERHLEDCERCRTAVAELATMPGLLAAARPVADPAPVGAGAEPPADLIQTVSERRNRRVRELRNRMVLGLAAAAVVATAIVIPFAFSQPAATATTIELAPVGSTSMTATVDLTPVAWGTRIEMECGYPSGYGSEGAGPRSYALVVTDDSGRSSQVSTWNAVPGETVTFETATSIDLEDIDRVEVTSASGDPFLKGVVGD